MRRSYSTLWEGYASDAEAKAARDRDWRNLRRIGVQARTTRPFWRSPPR